MGKIRLYQVLKMHFLKDLDFGYENTAESHTYVLRIKKLLVLAFRNFSGDPGSYFTF